ncbi:18767_t:CDS:2, partial [Dentiscutata erythropus]
AEEGGEDDFTTPSSDLLDHETFDQLLEMDDDDDHNFSKSIVWHYFEQAESTFSEMDQAFIHFNSKEINMLNESEIDETQESK